MRILLLSIMLFIGSALFSQDDFHIIPAPKQFSAQEGKFVFRKVMAIAVDNEIFMPVAELLANYCKKASGLDLPVKKSKSARGVVFKLNNKLADEAYRLSVTSAGIEVQAKTGAGAFYALQTLLQLMPVNVYGDGQTKGALTVSKCLIEDEPRFSYRGLMMDVGRHMFTVEEIKKFLDLMAMYKLNTFHWHLTEDQGWRIEIKKYPLLTKISSMRKESMLGHYNDQKFDGKPYGGFYTQEQIKEVVAYAASKYITVIPEIEMPGHSQAVLAAYPQLGANPDKIYEVQTRWGVSDDVLFPREETFAFLEDVLTEVMDLFPGQYIHIGGDECPKTQWKESRFCQDLIKKLGLKDEHELQSYFIRRIDKFISSKGRKLLGWDEILEGGLSPNATVMSWRGVSGGIEAAKQQHDVVMSPNADFYLDYYQDDPQKEPLAIGGHLTLEKCYSFNPNFQELTEKEAKHIIGLQANLWTEYINNFSYAEYMTFPRALALSEVAWSTKTQKNYPEFKKRVMAQLPALDQLKVKYAKSFLNQP